MSRKLLLETIDSEELARQEEYAATIDAFQPRGEDEMHLNASASLEAPVPRRGGSGDVDKPYAQAATGSVTIADALDEQWTIIHFDGALDGAAVCFVDGQTTAATAIFQGNGKERTFLCGADEAGSTVPHGEFFACGNLLAVRDLYWQGDLYAGGKNMDTEETTLHMENTLFTGILCGGSCHDNSPYVHNGEVEVELVNSTFTDASIVYAAGVVRSTSCLFNANLSICLEDTTGTTSKFYGGGLVANNGSIDADDVTIDVRGGTWGQFFGGARLGDGVAGGFYTAKDVVLNVRDGLFLNWLATGAQTRNGLSQQKQTILNISGGTFHNVAGGGVSLGGSVTITGDVEVNISGGCFLGYLFGGCGADNVAHSLQTNIWNSTTVTIDASATQIQFHKNIYGGSYGNGKVLKGTTILFRGRGENLVFSDDVVVSGSNQMGSIQSRFAYRSRNLRFQDFTGTLSCMVGNGFTSFSLSGSTVTLGNYARLESIETWEIELASPSAELTFGNLAGNGFSGDSLTLSLQDGARLASGEQWEFLAAAKSSQLNGWDGFASVNLCGENASFAAGEWNSSNYRMFRQGNSLFLAMI